MSEESAPTDPECSHDKVPRAVPPVDDPVRIPLPREVKGGFARAAKLTPEQRREIARKAAQARWERFRNGIGSGPPDPRLDGRHALAWLREHIDDFVREGDGERR